jgi:hypothetical protein
LRESRSRKGISECEQVIERLIVHPFLLRHEDLCVREDQPLSSSERKSGEIGTLTFRMRTMLAEGPPAGGKVGLSAAQDGVAMDSPNAVHPRGPKNLVVTANRDSRERRLGCATPLDRVCILRTAYRLSKGSEVEACRSETREFCQFQTVDKNVRSKQSSQLSAFPATIRGAEIEGEKCSAKLRIGTENESVAEPELIRALRADRGAWPEEVPIAV